MKKIFTVMLSAVLLLNGGSITPIYAENENPEETEAPAEVVEETVQETEGEAEAPAAEEAAEPAAETAPEETGEIPAETEAVPEEATAEEPEQEKIPETEPVPEEKSVVTEEIEEFPEEPLSAEEMSETEEPHENLPEEETSDDVMITEEADYGEEGIDSPYMFGEERSDINAYTFFVWLSQNTSQSQIVRDSAATAVKLIDGSMTEAEMWDENLLKYQVDNAYSIYTGLYSYTKDHLGETGNATEWSLFQYALDQIEVGNARRALESVPALNVSSVMMAMAILNANRQIYEYGHPNEFQSYENLASATLRNERPYINPYMGWYDTEKQVYDYVKAKGWVFKELTAEQKQEIINNCSLVTDVRFVQIGHYENLTDKNRAKTTTGYGFAYSAEKLDWAYDCQVFGNDYSYKDGADGIPVSEFRALVAQYEAASAGTTVLLNKTELTLRENETETLKATVTPAGTAVSWSSNDTSVATVSQTGEITAIAEGTAVITATAQDDSSASASCSLTVTAATVPVTGVSLNQTSLALEEGNTSSLTATVSPANATDKTVTWSSSNSSVATVNQNGQVTAVGAGNATITVTTTDGNWTATCAVTVTAAVVHVTDISLDLDVLRIPEGKTGKLTATVLPDNAANKTVIWSSGDTSVATVDQNGNVRGLKNGNTTITAVTEDGNKMASCTVYVDVAVTSVSLNHETMTVSRGEYGQLTATVHPENATNKEVEWFCDDSSVINITQSGRFSTLKAGTATVTVRTKDGNKEATCLVTVVIPVTKVTLDYSQISFPAGSTKQLTATVYPTNASNKNISWSSSDTSVVTVDSNGLVTAVGSGNATVTVITEDGQQTATCDATVYSAAEHVTGIRFERNKETVDAGNFLALQPTVLPETAQNKNVTFASSNPSVASVTGSGDVRGNKAGIATITATTEDGGFTATCQVTVNPRPVLVRGITLDESEITLRVDGYKTITAKLSPENTTETEIIWESDNTDVATVNDGYIWAFSPGTATITATTANGSYSATCTVTVLEEPIIYFTDISCEETYVSIGVGQSYSLHCHYEPEDANAVKWFESYNPDIAVIDENGTITGVSEGTATVEAWAPVAFGISHGKSVVVDVRHIDGESVPVTEIILDQVSEEVSEGDQFTLVSRVLPENATTKLVTWSSDNENVATVDENGVVKARGAGTARITATTVDQKKTDTCIVTVKANPEQRVYMTSVWSNQNSLDIHTGETIQVEYGYTPADATDTLVTYDTLNHSVATVDDSGLVTAVSPGETWVRIKQKNPAPGTEPAEELLRVRVEENTIRVDQICYDYYSLTMHAGNTVAPKIHFVPENATDKSLSFTSDNESVATVDQYGNITAVSTGTAKITASHENRSFDATDTCIDSIEITVVADDILIPVESIRLELEQYTYLTLQVGDSQTVKAQINPETASDKTISWTSSDESVVNVSNGKVTGLSAGTATVTAYTSNPSIYAFFTVYVNEKPDGKIRVTDVTLNKQRMTLTKGNTEKLTATIHPSDASNKNISWRSSDTSVVTVDSNGLVTAVGSGSATVTVTTVDGQKTAACKVTVAVPVTGISLDKNTLKLKKGDSTLLQATVTPANAADKSVIWKSSNTKVAEVNQLGGITGKATGTATITAITRDGSKKATCTVTIHQPVEGIKLNKTSLSLNKGKTSVLTATVSPSDASNKKVTWKTSNAKVAAVDQNGKVTAKGAGTATITVLTVDGKMSSSCKVTVTIPAASVKLNKTSLTLNKGKTAALTATVSPSDASNKKVTWTSSNTKVATVDSKGKVTAKAAGTATITVKTADGNRTATCKITVKAADVPAGCKLNGFCTINGKDYWYENGVRQGTVNDPNGVIGDGTVRGREIFDPATGAWYWLDSAYDGAKAVGKEVWMPYIYQDEKNWKNDTKRMNDTVQAINSYSEAGGPTSDMGEQVRKSIQKGTGKWVRYDQNGKMMKGWVTINTPELIALYPGQKGNTYFYDYTTGLMAKGWTTIGGRRYFFDESSGVLRQ